MSDDNASTSDNWIRWHRASANPAVRLVCLPHAGGAASAFRSWPQGLPGTVEVGAVCYPGRENRFREPCLNRMAPVADAVADALAPLADRPLVLFGHSMGASVAHEATIRLEQRGTPPAMLLVSGHRPPAHLRPRDLHVQGDEAIVADVLRLAPESGVALEDPDLRELLMPAIRADYELVETYRPEQVPVTAVPIVAYVGDDDPRTSVDEAKAWSETTIGGFDLQVFPGDHFYLRDCEAELVSDVRRRLEPIASAAGWSYRPAT